MALKLLRGGVGGVPGLWLVRGVMGYGVRSAPLSFKATVEHFLRTNHFCLCRGFLK